MADGYPGAKVLDQAGYKDDQTSSSTSCSGSSTPCSALAILIALLGIANTLALSIIERTRELGMMRAVGMTRSQLRSMIRWESVIIAIQGTVLGLVVGVFFGWALVLALADEGIDRFSASPSSASRHRRAGGIAGVVAAILAARRAAKLDILREVTSE